VLFDLVTFLTPKLILNFKISESPCWLTGHEADGVLRLSLAVKLFVQNTIRLVLQLKLLDKLHLAR
jgi:hypothetical protein